MKHLYGIVVSLALVLAGGCATTAVEAPGWILPEEAVMAAARAAPEGVEGTFALRVQATGTQGDRSYLNSELDYRDQRNLTVALSRRAVDQLADRLGADPLEALVGRDILVEGSAVRTRIGFIANGRMTDRYYFQTHVNVDDASQVTVRVEADAGADQAPGTTEESP